MGFICRGSESLLYIHVAINIRCWLGTMTRVGVNIKGVKWKHSILVGLGIIDDDKTFKHNKTIEVDESGRPRYTLYYLA